ncbi:hypothetical protein ISN45_At03g033380 [Arabidopsis thaliana x Arabidopsis arenosa]|uniref:Uncharacterized protein n=1 Tax=Arabidopsis thaliana x Arabidopsis arenosa TaxID=1240361 RepID=A0A8T2F6B6_9BRAS|nr:hypothetical protein ISN45_At03g033380 [Arabidopsis thaliana x Arabidopsis arenosa]
MLSDSIGIGLCVLLYSNRGLTIVRRIMIVHPFVVCCVKLRNVMAYEGLERVMPGQALHDDVVVRNAISFRLLYLGVWGALPWGIS